MTKCFEFYSGIVRGNDYNSWNHQRFSSSRGNIRWFLSSNNPPKWLYLIRCSLTWAGSPLTPATRAGDNCRIDDLLVTSRLAPEEVVGRWLHALWSNRVIGVKNEVRVSWVVSSPRRYFRINILYLVLTNRLEEMRGRCWDLPRIWSQFFQVGFGRCSFRLYPGPTVGWCSGSRRWSEAVKGRNRKIAITSSLVYMRMADPLSGCTNSRWKAIIAYFIEKATFFSSSSFLTLFPCHQVYGPNALIFPWKES